MAVLSDSSNSVSPNNNGVRAFRTHYDDLLEAFMNTSTPAEMSDETATILSDETRKNLSAVKLNRTRQNVSELLDEIDTSLRFDHLKFYLFLENLRKDNANNPSAQQLCDKLHSTYSRNLSRVDTILPVSTVPPGPVDLPGVPDGMLGSSHLSVLVTALSRVHHKWLPLGIYLGLSDSNLLEIHTRNQGKNDEIPSSEMLAMWLSGVKTKRNKQFLQRALKRLTAHYATASSSHSSTTVSQDNQPLRSRKKQKQEIVQRTSSASVSSTQREKSLDMLSKEPEMHELTSHVAKKTLTKWYEVGIELMMDTATLDGFNEQTRDQTKLYIKVFKQWKREKKVPYTWTTIIDALEEVGERKVASNIRKWLSSLT